MKNYITLEVGGKIRGLRFNMGTLDFIFELTGIDPLEFRAATTEYKDIKEYGKTLFHASLLSECRSRKEEPGFTAEEVSEWFNELSWQEVALIIKTSQQAPQTSSANGEAGKDTQQATHLAGTN